MRINEIKLNESTSDEKDSHDIYVSFSEHGPNININIRSNNLKKYYKSINIFDLYDQEDVDHTSIKNLMSEMEPIHKNAEKQMVELTNAYIEMLKAIITDASNKVNSLGDKNDS